MMGYAAWPFETISVFGFVAVVYVHHEAKQENLGMSRCFSVPLAMGPQLPSPPNQTMRASTIPDEGLRGRLEPCIGWVLMQEGVSTPWGFTRTQPETGASFSLLASAYFSACESSLFGQVPVFVEMLEFDYLYQGPVGTGYIRHPCITFG